MSYAVKEIYFTLQGEGYYTGRPAVFCRFAGCNLWSGREIDRPQAVCTFCDTDFVGLDGSAGGTYESPADLAAAINLTWYERRIDAEFGPLASVCLGDEPEEHSPFVVFTGGEPLLQLDAALVAAVRQLGFTTAIETNGTRNPPAGVDWVCVSPKPGAELKVTCGDELKLVYPQEDAPPDLYAALDFDYFFLQPMDGPHLERNSRMAADYCLRHSQWRMSVQTHKLLGLR
jgi:7-carboxy-7-deazaguanine synthase (Cx14CxxC type)